MTAQNYLTVTQAARAVQPVPVTPKTIRRAIRRGRLQAFQRTLGKRPQYFIAVDDLHRTFSMIQPTNP
jgi:hypothetical protein